MHEQLVRYFTTYDRFLHWLHDYIKIVNIDWDKSDTHYQRKGDNHKVKIVYSAKKLGDVIDDLDK